MWINLDNLEAVTGKTIEEWKLSRGVANYLIALESEIGFPPLQPGWGLVDVAFAFTAWADDDAREWIRELLTSRN